MRALPFLLFCSGCSHPPSTGPDASPPDAGPWACPPNPPALGSPCPPPLACEYKDPSACGMFYLCAGTNELSFTWGSQYRECSTRACMSMLDAGDPCTFSSTRCTVGNRSCTCTECIDDGGLQKLEWVCQPYGPAQGCPSDPPRFGSACEQEALLCDYRDCSNGLGGGIGPAARCLAGLWIADPMAPCTPPTPQPATPSCP